MGTEIIPYDIYHPHLGYTLTITCLAWICVGLYSHFYLQQRPKQRIGLYVVAIGLPVYAESVSYLIYMVRPAPDTPIGYVLSHFHAFVLQRIPLDTFLEPLTEEILLCILALLMLVSLLRFGYGTLRLAAALRGSSLLGESPYHALAAAFATTAAHFGRPAPTIHLIRQKAPLAFTTGLVRPKIYLSYGLLEVLSAEEVIAVLCHEWAHILRRDNLWNWAVRLLRDLLFFLPGNHLLWQSMIASQDEACDALAAQMTREPLTLARALVKVAAAWRKLPSSMPLPVASPVAMANANPRSRVEQMIRLSELGPPMRQSIGAYVLAAALLLLAVLPALLGS
jgi:Zn-dependent protease with chaperone function